MHDMRYARALARDPSTFVRKPLIINANPAQSSVTVVRLARTHTHYPMVFTRRTRRDSMD